MSFVTEACPRAFCALLWMAVVTTIGCAGTEGPVYESARNGGTAVAGSSGNGVDEPGLGGTPSTEDVWVPATDVFWQLQLVGSIDHEVDAELFVIDLDAVDDITALVAAGRQVACYFSAGTLEPWRDDTSDISEEVVGEPLDDFPDESWLDHRDETVRSTMERRIERAASRNCSAVVPTNLDAHVHSSDLSLSEEDGIAFARVLAHTAHASGLSVAASSTDVSLSAAIAPDYDWVLAVGCLQANTCSAFAPFVETGKPLLDVEVVAEADRAALCELAASGGINLIFKEEDLGSSRAGCLL